MSRFTGPRRKVAKRFAVNLWGRRRDPLGETKRGQRRRGGKKSNYGVRLDEKQKLRYFYGRIRESQFKKYYAEARNVKGNIGTMFLQLLERRLDVVVYRMNFLPTIFASRQVVNHGHVKVNGKKVDIASYRVKPGDKISVSETIKNTIISQDYVQDPERDTPDYVEFDTNTMEGTLVRVPARDEIMYPFTIDEHMIVEYYSR